MEDLEDFRLFAKAKLNLSQGTVYNYVSKVRTFLSDRKTVTDRDIQCYIETKKKECCLFYVSNIISAFKAYFRDYRVFFLADGTGTVNEEMHLASLLNLAFGFAHVTAADEILRQLQA